MKKKKNVAATSKRMANREKGLDAEPAISKSRSKNWFFRLTSLILAPLVAFLILECILALAGFGHSTAFFRSWQIDGQKVFVENKDFGLRFFPPSLTRFPRAVVLPDVKPSNACRIFVLGESAAYGDPQPDFGLPRMLEALLRGRYPGVRFEVVNAAMTAINSHAILPIAKDCAQRDGDIWVVYPGNNEVIGPYGAGTAFGLQSPYLTLIRASLALRASKTGQLLERAWRIWNRRRTSEPEWGGLLMFVKNQIRAEDPRMAAVYSHFQSNLEDILKTGARAGVKVIIGTMAVNLKDCAPFASLHRPTLRKDEEAEWDRLYQKGVEAQKAGNHKAAAEYYAQAGQIDDRFAELQYRWGMCCLALEQDAEAKRRLSLARDYDVLRFRADSRINDIIQKTSQGREKEGIYYLDLAEALARRSPHGLTGAELLHEHVHLNFDGNYWLARSIADKISGILPERIASIANSNGDWPSRSDCARELAWTDWDEYETAATILVRIEDAPFTRQLDHEEQYQRLQKQMKQLLPLVQPEGLRHAAVAYRQVMARSPDDWCLCVRYSELAQKLGDPSRSYESWKRVAQLLPHHDEVHYQLGMTQYRQGRFSEAIQHFQEALRRQPESVQSWNGLGLALAQMGRHQEALSAYRNALKIKPEYFDTNLNMGNTLMALGRKEEAKTHYRTAYARKANVPGELVVLAGICAAQGWTQEAIDACERAIRLAPFDPMPQLALGNVLTGAGRHADSQKCYAEVVRLAPAMAEGHFRLGLAYGRQGLDAQALAEFLEAVRLAPDMVEARLNLGVALLKQNRNEEASGHFKEVLRLSPKNAMATKYLESIAARQSN